MKKQSNYFIGLWEVRLLRSARNDSLFEFLRDYHLIIAEILSMNFDKALGAAFKNFEETCKGSDPRLI